MCSGVWKPDAIIFGENELFGYEGEFQPYLKPEVEKIVTEPHNFRIQDNDLGAGRSEGKV